MYKKILFSLILSLGFYQGAFADLVYKPDLTEIVNLRYSVSSTFDFTTSYTGSIIYLDSMVCEFGNRTASGDMYRINLYESGAIKTHLYAIEGGTYTLKLGHIFTDSFRLTASQVGTSWITAAGCNIYGWTMSKTKYQGLVDLQSNTGSLYIASSGSSTGSIDTQNIENALNFQNDYLIIVLGFLVFVFFSFLFFNLYQFLKAHYFFNK